MSKDDNWVQVGDALAKAIEKMPFAVCDLMPGDDIIDLKKIVSASPGRKIHRLKLLMLGQEHAGLFSILYMDDEIAVIRPSASFNRLFGGPL